MALEKITKYIIIIAGIAGALFLFPFLLNAVAPFAAAFFIATLCQRLVRFLERKFKLNRGIISAVIVTLIVVLVLGLIVLAVVQVLAQAKNLAATLPDMINAFRNRLSNLSNRFKGFRLSLPSDTVVYVDSFMEGFQTYSLGLSETVAATAIEGAGNLAASLPKIMIFVTMLILGTFFFIKDYQLVINFLSELLPSGVLEKLTTIKSIVIKAFSSYIKAQLILMLLTSGVTAFCLWIAGMDYALLWGIICGLVDALPLLGTTAILIPWAIISFIYGDMYSFTALLIIQALVIVVRQLAEPKIISHQIGIHPILSLISVYIGLKYFGLTGVFLAPILTLLGVNIYVTYKERQ